MILDRFKICVNKIECEEGHYIQLTSRMNNHFYLLLMFLAEAITWARQHIKEAMKSNKRWIQQQQWKKNSRNNNIHYHISWIIKAKTKIYPTVLFNYKAVYRSLTISLWLLRKTKPSFRAAIILHFFYEYTNCT